MSRRLGRDVFFIFVIALAASPSGRTRAATPQVPTIVQRFLQMDGAPPFQYRALRHLEAQNDHFDSTAWLDAWTEADANGFRYEIIAEGGSAYIRRRVLMATLDEEQKEWRLDEDRGAFTASNYSFVDRGTLPDGLASVGVKPRRKDLTLVDGSIFLNPEDADLVRLEGRLSKSPSFWTRRVDIVRRFQRIAGVRMPVELESTANVLIAGHSTFHMTYDYETVNGHHVGVPQPPAQAPAPSPR